MLRCAGSVVFISVFVYSGFCKGSVLVLLLVLRGFGSGSLKARLRFCVRGEVAAGAAEREMK